MLLLALVLAGVALWLGYDSWVVERMRREAADAAPATPRAEYVRELAKARTAMTASLAESSRTLERTRDVLRRQVEG